jgi:coenzyme F420-0:L-glutamate ligase/coenzyme F420-1:gamma-L-glutamate ligase
VNAVTIIPVEGIPEVEAGDDLATLILATEVDLFPRDILVVAQKVVSKAEDRFVEARERTGAAFQESTRVLRKQGDMIISQTRHGFVCANAGVDASNVEGDRVILLPLDPDLSARRIRVRVAHLREIEIGVVVADTFGRAWRIGQTNVAIGVAGFDPFIDYVGETDTFGQELTATRICVADQIAGAAEMVMKKTTGICAAVVRGAEVSWGRGAAISIARPPGEDLFR